MPTPGWLLDEQVTIGRENVDPDHVARYDIKEDGDAAAEVAMLRGHCLDQRATVVELGTRTGQFALAAAPHCERLVAVDPSTVMLDRLRAKAVDAPASLEVVEAGFLTYEHRGRPAGLVYTLYALHHLPDFWKAVALARIRAMLADDGVLRLWDVVFSFPVAETTVRVSRWRDDVERNAGEWTGADIDDHVRDEHSTFTWLLEPMLEHCGFTITETDYSDDGFFAQYVARAT